MDEWFVEKKMLIQSIFYRVIFFITNVYGFVKIVEGGYERCLPFIENVAILINIDLQNDIHHKYKLLFAVCKLYSRDLF